ncbi:MAG: YjjG family noncanonical pyrimidine nucleotidase [Bacteroidales bacterium]|jgi:putative hydrolase of the HAD superfamily|nr:YjjG family noncanonical pyrimidine nucleotidase [Bacteroidales bacterium]
MTKYKHLFFDLDRTLSDFDGNNRNTMFELYKQFDLKNKIDVDFETFFSTYKTINKMLWDAYGRGQIKKELLHVNRFHLTFKELGIDNLLMATEFAEMYLQNVPMFSALMPHAKEVLEFLKPNFKLYVITNGFKELQYQKLRNSGITHLFDDVFISEAIGFQKPHIAFFEHVLKKTGAKKEESLIIGDDMKSDIQGAKNIGIACVLYNPTNEIDLEPDYRIDSLLELKMILDF